jgi:hypothetical protein
MLHSAAATKSNGLTRGELLNYLLNISLAESLLKKPAS